MSHTQPTHPAPRVRRFLAAFALLFALSGTVLVGPAIVAPAHTSAAQATVHKLPPNATYNEYDVYSRARGAARDAYRIVVNRSTKETWFTPDHYVTFYKL